MKITTQTKWRALLAVAFILYTLAFSLCQRAGAQNGGTAFVVPVSGSGGVTTNSSGLAFGPIVGTGGINVTSNGANGTYTIDGTGISGPTNGTTLAQVTNVVTSYFSSSTNATTRPITNLLWGYTLFVDASNGNNTTAVPGDAAHPYKDPRAAKNAAMGRVVATGTPWTVYVRPGNYNTNDLLTNNVNWFFEAGAYLAYTNLNTTNNSQTALGLFDDRLAGAAGCTSIVAGAGQFYWHAGVAAIENGTGGTLEGNTNIGGTITITNVKSQVSFSGESLGIEAKYDSVAYGVAILVINCREATFNFNKIYDGGFNTTNVAGHDSVFDEDVLVTSSATGIWWYMGDMYVTCHTLKARNYAIYGSQSPGSTATGFWLTADQIENYGRGSCVYFNGAVGETSNWKSWINVKEIKEGVSSIGGYAIFTNGKHYLNVLKLGGNSPVNIVGVIGGELDVWITAQKIEVSPPLTGSASPWVTMSGVTNRTRVTIDCPEFSDAGMGQAGFNPIGFYQTGGQLFVRGNIAAMTNGLPIQHLGGSAKYSGMTFSTIGTNPAVLIRTNGVTLANCTLINTNIQFSITTDLSGTIPIKVYNSTATSTVTNKVTVQVGPLTIDPLVQ